MAADFDLFGHPNQPGKGQRGRPAFQVTPELSNRVKLLLSLGWSNPRIANACGTSPATLKRHFRSDLQIRDQMRDRLDARRVEVTAGLAFAGNVAALKELGRLVERNDLMLRAGQIEKPAPARVEQLGKKEAAAIAARAAEVSPDWGDDLKFDGPAN